MRDSGTSKLAAVFGMSLMVWLVCAGVLVTVLPILATLGTPPLLIAIVSIIIAGILSVVAALVYPVEATPVSQPVRRLAQSVRNKS